MNDKELIRQFNEDIDKLQNHQAIVMDGLTNDYAQELSIANQFYTFSSASLSHERLNIKQHLIEAVSSKSHQRQVSPRFSFVAVLGVCLLLILSSLVIPPVRTFAQDMIQSIGNFFFVDQPTDAENYAATMQSGTPTATPDPTLIAKITPQYYESGLLTAAEASAKAGFQVYTIGYLPDGFIISSRDILFTSQTITSHTSYHMELASTLHDSLQSSAIIALEQTLTSEITDPWIAGTGDIPVNEITIRGVRGAWIEQIPIYPFQNKEGEWDYARWNQLIWTENGFTLVLQTNLPADMLPLDELKKIAESIEP